MRLVDAHDAIHAAGDWRRVPKDAGHDLAEAEGHDREVVAPQAQCRGAEEDTEERRDEGRNWEQYPKRDVDVELTGRHDGKRVRANREECRVAQVEEDRIADDDIEPQREQQVRDVATAADGPQSLDFETAHPIDDARFGRGVWALHFSGTRMPKSPVGRNTSVRIKMLKTTTSDHCPPPWK